MDPKQPEEQLMLSLNTPVPPDGGPMADEAPHENVISFTDALERHEEIQKAEAIRRILSMSDDVKEG